MFLFALLAFGDIAWGALFSGTALVVAAWIARPTRATSKKIDSIDKAVNSQEHGMPTLVGRVISQDERGLQTAIELANFRRWTTESFKAFAAHQGVILPKIPDEVIPEETLDIRQE